MNPVLEDITSIINGFSNAKDKERVFTYIEFVKMFGYDNDTNIFISAYKDYVTQWAIVKKDSITLSDNDFVMSKMVEVLKSITLDYSSYEEQDFIAHVDLTNKDHLKGLTTFYSKKIREITEFYRKKRNESVLIVNRNSMKGSVKSIQEIIYEKVFDFIFSNRNIVPSYKNIKRDLLISIENYVDTYSEYFDIPRKKEFTDKSRGDMLSANINDVDYRVYIEIQLVISEILFSGNVFLEEIPLIAQVGADLSQSCVGDMLMLKNQLVANTTVNQVDLDEQVALKRKLYEKFLGCDLYYMYVDLQGNVKIDVLCNAKNPSGNLLNVGTADTATTENEQLELLSHIGLFFKPDKTSILKVNAKDYTWSVDTDVIQNDTVYIFPDPNKYGDIGNNKNNSYPLIMEYKVGYDVKNMSSGEACNDPIKFLSDQGWYSYYSKQDDDFKLFDNKNYDYAFTWLANKGFVSNYQVDVWGNQFGILKGCKVEYKTDKDGNKVAVSKITLNPKYNETFIKNETVDVSNSEPKILNGGYFENPFYKGQLQQTIEREKWKDNASKVPFQVIYDSELSTWRRKKTNEDDTNVWCRVIRNDVTEAEIEKVDGNNPTNYVKYKEITFKWVNSGSEKNAKPFDYTKQMTLINNADDKYFWSGLRIDNKGFYFSDINTNFVSYGNFGDHEGIIYKDHFEKRFSEYEELEKEDSIITDVVLEFLTNNMYESDEIEIIEEDKDFFEMRDESGEFYVKLCGKLGTKPILFSEAFPWVEFRDKELIKNFSIIYQTVVVETNERYIFIPYDYDGEKIVNTLGIREMYSIEKYKTIVSNNTEIKVDYLQTNLLFNEVTRSFYILAIEDLEIEGLENNYRRFLIPRFFEFDCINYKMKEVINFYESVCKKEWIEEQIDRISLFSEYLKKKDTISYNKIEEFKKLLNTIDDNNQYFNLGNFEIPYYPITKQELKKVSFSYNSNLGLYLLSFILFDKNETPYIHEHKFKLIDLDNFNASLVSNVYTLKNEGDSYKWNDVVRAGKVSTIPYNEKSITDNTIWERYTGQGNSNEGFGDTSIIVDFSGEDFDNNTNSKYKSWKSMVYEGSGFDYTLKPNRKVKGKIDFIDVEDGKEFCKIKKQGINPFKINYQDLVLTKKEDEKEDDITLETVEDDTYPFEFDVFCDIFGNISGNSTVKLKAKEDEITDKKRQVIGVARLAIGGTIENYKLDVIITIWDIYDNKIGPVPPPDPPNPGPGPGPWEIDNWVINMYSDVYLFDNISGDAVKSFDSSKKIRPDFNTLTIKVNEGSEDELVHVGKNTININFDQFFVKSYNSDTKEYGKEVLQYIIQADSDENGRGITFDLTIENSKNSKITFPNANANEKNSKKIPIKVNDVLVDSDGGITMGTNNYIIQEEGKSYKLNSRFDGKKVYIDLYGIINYQSCSYDCWVKYDAYGCPIEFSLDRMRNFDSFFANSNVDEAVWNFGDYNSKGELIELQMRDTTSMAMSWMSSRVGRAKIDNGQCVKTNNSFCNANWLYEVKFTDSENNAPLSKVVSARHMFSRTQVGIGTVRDITKRDQDHINTSFEPTEPQHYSAWYELVKNSDETMKISDKEGKALVAEFDERVVSNLCTTFNYTMTELRCAHMMFLPFVTRIWDPAEKWLDDGTPKCTEYSGYWSTVTNKFKLHNKREHDFASIELKTPNLRGGAGMFMNRPLRVSEAEIFAESLPNLNDKATKLISVTAKDENGNTVKDENGNDKVYEFGGGTWVQEFNFFLNELRMANKGKNDAVDYLLARWGTQISNSADPDATLGDYYLSKIGTNCPLRENVNGQDAWLFPTITLFFDLTNFYDYDSACGVIDTISKKGWEIATNIHYIYDPDPDTDPKPVIIEGRTSYSADESNEKEYVCRALEFNGNTGFVLFMDAATRASQKNRQDYHIDFCKGVSNAFYCDDKTAWVRLGQLWRRSSLVNSNNPDRNMYAFSQILGELIENDQLIDENGQIKTSEIYSEGGYCLDTWKVCDYDEFTTKYNLQSYQ